MRHIHNNNAYGLPTWRSRMESEKVDFFANQPSQPQSPGLQAAKGFHSIRASSVIPCSLTKGLVIWWTGCHVFIVRSSGQTGFSDAQRFFWQTENINSSLGAKLGESSVPRPWLSWAHILPLPPRHCLLWVLLGKLKSHDQPSPHQLLREPR